MGHTQGPSPPLEQPQGAGPGRVLSECSYPIRANSKTLLGPKALALGPSSQCLACSRVGPAQKLQDTPHNFRGGGEGAGRLEPLDFEPSPHPHPSFLEFGAYAKLPCAAMS
jgi:hypothetical protein